MIRYFLSQVTRLAGGSLMLLATLAAADDAQQFNRLQDQSSQQCAAGQYAKGQQTALAMRRLAEGPLKANPAFLIHALRAQATSSQGQARYSEAEPLLQQALALSEKSLGSQHLEVSTSLGALANLYLEQGRYSAAEPPARQALAILEKAGGGQQIMIAADLKILGGIYLQQARYAEAEPLLKRAIALCEAARGPDDVWVAGNVGTLGTLYREQGRYAEAEPLLKRAIAINERAVGPEHPWVADWLNNLARLYSVQGRYAEAESICKRSLAIREKAKGRDHPGVAGDLKVLATLYANQGHYAEAEPLLKRAVAICEKSLPASHPLIAGNLGSLATLYMNQGRYAEAEPLLRRAIAIDEKALGTEHPWVADWLNSLALSYYHQRRFAEAEPLFQRALEIVEKTKGANHAEYARGLLNLSMLYDEQGNFQKAEPMIRKALAIWKNTLGPDNPQLGIGLGRLSQILFRQGRYAEAEPLADQSIAILDRAGCAPGRRFESYLLRARVAWKRQLRNEALADLQQAMQLAEQQRAESSGSARERAETFTKYNDAFEQMVAWQVEIKDTSETLAAMERGRARSLLEDMTQSGVDLQAGRSTFQREAQCKQELQLKQQVDVLEKQLDALQADPQTPAAEKPAKRQKLEVALAKARKAFYEHYRDVRATSPVYRQLLTVGSGPPRLSQIQRRLAGKAGLLLAYLLGSEGGYVLAIGPEQAELTVLTIDDSAAKILEIKAGPLTANRLAGALENEQGTGVVQQLRDPKNDSRAREKLFALWQVLIPAAQRQALTGGKLKRLIVIPDGKLALLPFETLVIDASGPAKYLLDVGPAIQYGPSATVLYNLDARVPAAAAAGREPVLTVGNPDYSGQGEVAAANAGDVLHQLATRSRYGALGGKLAALPYSGWESAWVADAFQKAGIKTLQLQGAAATKAKVRAEMEGRRIIHLACHGLADQSYGNIFGALALSPDSQPAGAADDGFLTLSEIYDLNLHSTELTILSACETNYGPQQRGEGVWALSRGFLVAGARRVVASNWLIDDEAGANLISFFCSYLAQAEKAGQPPDYADALRRAKLGIRGQEKWSSPYYWGTLVLIGPN